MSLGYPTYPVVPALSTTNLVLDLNADLGVTLATGVSAWASQVGTFVAAQSTASKQPLVGTWGSRGHSCISFDGVDDILVIPWEAALDWATPTVFIVGRYVMSSTDTATPSVFLGRPFSLAAGTPFYELNFYLASLTALEARVDGNAISATLPNTATLNQAFIASLTVGASGSSLHFNGDRIASHATTSISYANSLGIGIGGRATTTEAEWSRWDCARIVAYSAALTAAQRFAVLGALAEDYRTPVPTRSETP